MKDIGTRITPNEAAILDRLARGESIQEIADSWGRSKTMVYRILQRARRTMGARSDVHAVALFIERFRNGDLTT